MKLYIYFAGLCAFVNRKAKARLDVVFPNPILKISPHGPEHRPILTIRLANVMTKPDSAPNQGSVFIGGEQFLQWELSGFTVTLPRSENDHLKDEKTFKGECPSAADTPGASDLRWISAMGKFADCDLISPNCLEPNPYLTTVASRLEITGGRLFTRTLAEEGDPVRVWEFVDHEGKPGKKKFERAIAHVVRYEGSLIGADPAIQLIPFGPGSKSAIYLQEPDERPVIADILNAEYHSHAESDHDPDEHFFAYFDLLDNCKDHTHTPLRPHLTEKTCGEGGGKVEGNKPVLCTKATLMREGDRRQKRHRDMRRSVSHRSRRVRSKKIARGR